MNRDFAYDAKTRLEAGLLVHRIVRLASLIALVFAPMLSTSATAQDDRTPSAATAPGTHLDSAADSAEAKTALTQWPERSFGYVIGDTIIQRVLLTTANAHNTGLELSDPLPLTRVGKWLERQSSQVMEDPEDNHWLEVTYQVVNTPTVVTDDVIPALTLTLSNGAALSVPIWQYSLGPLTPADAANGQFSIQPDRSPVFTDTAKASHRLRQAWLALALTLLVWLLWWVWRYRRDKVRLPFAKAWQQIRHIERTNDGVESTAWIALHDALNQHAGRTVQSASVADLVEQSPWLQPLQPQLEQFYQASKARFFEQPPRAQNFALRELSEALFQAEKRHSD